MMKKSLKKMVICFFMMVGIMGAVAVPTEAKSHVNYTKIYKKFAKKQVKKKKKNLYMAVVKLDTPVLLITDHVWDGTVNMAHLYQYHRKSAILDTLALGVLVQNLVIIKNIWCMVDIIFPVE